MLSSWNKCFLNVLKYEGGYVNDPLDRGGATNLGITQNTLNKAIREGVVQTSDVKYLTKDDASKIYKKYYWDVSNLDSIAYPLDSLIFDANVNHGIKNSTKITQRALVEFGEKLRVDGSFGPITKTALKNASDKNATLLCEIILQKRKEFYDSIIRNNPSQIRFKNGWYNRLRNLAKDNGLTSPV